MLPHSALHGHVQWRGALLLVRLGLVLLSSSHLTQSSCPAHGQVQQAGTPIQDQVHILGCRIFISLLVSPPPMASTSFFFWMSVVPRSAGESRCRGQTGQQLPRSGWCLNVATVYLKSLKCLSMQFKI